MKQYLFAERGNGKEKERGKEKEEGRTHPRRPLQTETDRGSMVMEGLLLPFLADLNLKNG